MKSEVITKTRENWRLYAIGAMTFSTECLLLLSYTLFNRRSYVIFQSLFFLSILALLVLFSAAIRKTRKKLSFRILKTKCHYDRVDTMKLNALENDYVKFWDNYKFFYFCCIVISVTCVSCCTLLKWLYTISDMALIILYTFAFVSLFTSFLYFLLGLKYFARIFPSKYAEVHLVE